MLCLSIARSARSTRSVRPFILQAQFFAMTRMKRHVQSRAASSKETSICAYFTRNLGRISTRTSKQSSRNCRTPSAFRQEPSTRPSRAFGTTSTALHAPNPLAFQQQHKLQPSAAALLEVPMADTLFDDIAGCVVGAIDASGWADGTLSKQVIDKLVECTRNRPHPWSTASDYTSWKSLIDRTYQARHLPAAAP